MKTFGKWLLRLVTSVLTICLVLVLFPYASKAVYALLPDMTGSAVNTSFTLFHEMHDSARLETSTVTDEGVVSATYDAAFIGDFSSITIKYTYTASLGIDLSKVQMSVRGNNVTLYLPGIEVLNDGIIEDEVARDDWLFAFSDSARMKLLQQERIRCREKAQSEYAASEEAWLSAVKAFESTFGSWMEKKGLNVTIKRLMEH